MWDSRRLCVTEPSIELLGTDKSFGLTLDHIINLSDKLFPNWSQIDRMWAKYAAICLHQCLTERANWVALLCISMHSINVILYSIYWYKESLIRNGFVLRDPLAASSMTATLTIYGTEDSHMSTGGSAITAKQFLTVKAVQWSLSI